MTITSKELWFSLINIFNILVLNKLHEAIIIIFTFQGKALVKLLLTFSMIIDVFISIIAIDLYWSNDMTAGLVELLVTEIESLTHFIRITLLLTIVNFHDFWMFYHLFGIFILWKTLAVSWLVFGVVAFTIIHVLCFHISQPQAFTSCYSKCV